MRRTKNSAFTQDREVHNRERERGFDASFKNYKDLMITHGTLLFKVRRKGIGGVRFRLVLIKLVFNTYSSIHAEPF